MASIAKFLGNPAMMEPSFHLTEIVRNGRTSLPGEGSVEPDNPVWVQFAQSMAPMMAAHGWTDGRRLRCEGHSGPMRVLDIAAGHGLFGIAVAKQNPAARITAVDWAAVLRGGARATPSKAGVDDRYETLPGSAFDVDSASPTTPCCSPTSCTISTILPVSRC